MKRNHIKKLLPFSSERKKQIKLSLILTFLLVFVVAFLITSSKAVELVESKVTAASNLPWERPQYLQAEDNREYKGYKLVVYDGNITPPPLSAQAAIAIDLETGTILYQKNIHQRLSPASTTKIMTALVAMENYQIGDILEVPPQAQVSGSSMGLTAYEKLTFRSLLYGMMLNSGNDAAYTLALNYPGGLDSFVVRMNQKAKELDLSNTNFQNPAGYDGPAHYSSAYDLAQIAKAAIEDPQLSRIVATKQTQVLSFDQTKSHFLKNLNILLSEQGVLGIKTGYTEKSGENFVGLVERDGHKVLTVVLSSTDRFSETKAMIDWIFKNFSWKKESS